MFCGTFSIFGKDIMPWIDLLPKTVTFTKQLKNKNRLDHRGGFWQ
jgi:hypothetical protein